MKQADVADVLQASGHDMWEAPAEQLEDVSVCGAEACTAPCPGGERARGVLEADEALGGAGDLEDRGGQGGAGGRAVVLGLRVDVPGDGPDRGIDRLQETGLAPVCFAPSAGEGGAGCHGDKAGGAGGAPGGAVLGKATARDAVVDVGVVLEVPAPGGQDAGDPREVGPAAALVGGEPREGRGRGVNQGLVREALVGADEGAERLRDGAGQEDVRPGQLCVEVGGSPCGVVGC
jgi:hypothetical protein